MRILKKKQMLEVKVNVETFLDNYKVHELFIKNIYYKLQWLTQFL